ncbi:hypothetical protein OsI_11458 [Oryza sativa Indica Group]|uniref:Uncharacterized protein n=1 Tax=Oryza sativa subsp. indica TaxID=39946 RepID=B8AP01_ORYSI|nr:hypothetical protein OsI_11458 [Oryza sativa Indica Group]
MWWWRPIAATAAALDEGFGDPTVENLAAEMLSFGQKMAERAVSHCRANTPGTAKACSEPCIGKVVSRNGSLFISLFSFPALCRGDHLFHGEVTLDLPSSLLAPTRGQSYLDFAPANATSACAAREHGDGRKGGQEVGGGLGGFELMSTTSTRPVDGLLDRQCGLIDMKNYRQRWRAPLSGAQGREGGEWGACRCGLLDQSPLLELSTASSTADAVSLI